MEYGKRTWTRTWKDISEHKNAEVQMQIYGYVQITPE